MSAAAKKILASYRPSIVLTKDQKRARRLLRRMFRPAKMPAGTHGRQPMLLPVRDPDE